MKKVVIILICLAFANVGISQGKYQKKYETIVHFDPSEHGLNGYKLDIKLKGNFDAFFGEPTYLHLAKAKKVGTRIHIDGQWYDESQFHEKMLRQININGVIDFQMGIYQGANRVSTVVVRNAIEFDMAGSPSWDRIFPGLSADEAKYLYKNGYSIRDFKLLDVEDIQHGLRAVENHIRKSKEAQGYIDEAGNLERRGDLEGAVDQYEKAYAVQPKPEFKDKIETLKKQIEEEKMAAQYDAAIDAAEKAESNGDKEAAIAYYKEAARIDPSKSQPDAMIEVLEKEKKEFNESMAKAEKAEASGDTEEAEKHYKKAAELDPNNNEARSKSVELAEVNREKRLTKWNEKNKKAQEAKERRDAELMAAQVGTVSMMSVFMFQNLGEDKRKNIFNPTGMNTKWEFGYGISSTSIVVEEFVEYYDGNNYSTSTDVETGEVLLLDVMAGLEWWPVRVKYLELGGFFKGNYGVGASGEMGYGYDFGGMVDVGTPGFKLIGRFKYGNQTGFVSDVNSGDGINITTSGDYNLRYSSRGYGVKFSFDSWNSRGNIELIYEKMNLQDTYAEPVESVVVSYWASNRLKIGIQYAWDLPRHTSDYISSGNNFHDDDDFGSLFSIRMTRLIDLYRN